MRIIDLGRRNVPLITCITKISTALLTGNTIIVKPSPYTPLTTLRFIQDIQDTVPPGVLNVLSGDDGLGPMITSHPGIDKVRKRGPWCGLGLPLTFILCSKISFTGSSFTGQKVMQSASVGLKRITLELGMYKKNTAKLIVNPSWHVGGNDPAIILPDVDPKVVAP